MFPSELATAIGTAANTQDTGARVIPTHRHGRRGPEQPQAGRRRHLGADRGGPTQEVTPAPHDTPGSRS